MKFANKEALMASINGWKETLRTNIYHPKPDPLPEVIEQFPPELNQMVLEASGHKAEHDRLWEDWFCEQFSNIGNTLNAFAQLTRQWKDHEGKSGVFQLGRKELKDIIQAEIVRLQQLVDEM